AWVNYGIQAAVLGCVLVGRALDRTLASPTRGWRAALIGLMALLVLGEDLNDAYRAARRGLANWVMLKRLVDDPRLREASRDIYFVGLPQYNRLIGRGDLAHDEWLYGLFERAAAAESRRRWLRPELTTGAVRLVVVPQDPPFVMPLDPPVVPGLSE